MVMKKDVDGGWAYVVLASSCLCLIICATVTMSVGMFQTEFLDHFHGNTSYVSFICAMMLALQSLLGMVSSILCRLFGSRVTTMLGAAILSVGFVATSLASDLQQLLVFFGIISGVGYGIMYTSCAVVVNHYFYKNRPLANGILFSSSGLGTLSGPHLIGWLLEHSGWRYTLVIFACIILQICVLGSLFFPLQNSTTTCHSVQRSSSTTAVARTSDNSASSLLSFLKNRFIWILFCSYFMLMWGYSMVLVHFPTYVKSTGTPLRDVPLLYTVYGSVGMGARLLGGMFCNNKDVDLLLVYAACQFLVGLVTVMMPLFAHTFLTLAVYMAVFSIYYGCLFIIVSPIVVEYIGLDHVSMSFGAILLCGGFGVLTGPPFAGWLYDEFGSYAMAFHTAGFVIILGSLLLLLIPIVVGKPPSQVMPAFDTLVVENAEEKAPLNETQ